MISPIDQFWLSGSQLRSICPLSHGYLTMSGDNLRWCATGIQWVEDRDAAERAGQPLNTHNYLAWNVNRVDAEKPRWHFDVCSVAKSCLTLCDPLDSSTPGFPVLQYLPEFAQTYVHWVGDAIQPSHPLSPSSPFAASLSQHQGLF